MQKPNILMALLLAMLLTACGGSSDPVVPDSGTGNNDGTSTDDGNLDGVTTSPSIERPRLGTGVGSSFELGSLNLTSATLSAGGTTSVSANVVDIDNNNSRIVSQQYGIEFTSGCVDTNKASFSRPEVVTSNGQVLVTYEAKGCSGDDVISFKLYPAEAGEIDKTNLLHTAVATINVIPPEVGAIVTLPLEQPALAVNTIANSTLPHLIEVGFQVVDQTNNPISNKNVTFKLVGASGGAALALTSGVTDEDGRVKAVLQSGSTHAIVSVVATTLANDGVTSISTSSLPISITTGLPRQDRFSLALETFNPGAYNINNVAVSATVSASDAFGNPVPDGTVVNFTAESGIITPFCTTEEGVCSVIWRSGGARPDFEGVHPTLKTVNERIGMTTILAYSVGESGFTDQNGNYTFDVSPNPEPFLSFAEAFRDDNWNGVLDLDDNDRPVEPFIDYDSNGALTAAPSFYQGALCSEEARALGHCANLMHVRAQNRLMQSVANSVTISFYSFDGTTYTSTTPPDLEGVPGDTGDFYVVLQDANGNIPASGTSLAISGDGYDVLADEGNVPNSIGILGLNQGNGLPNYGALYRVSYAVDDDPKKIEITATSGDKTVKVRLFP